MGDNLLVNHKPVRGVVEIAPLGTGADDWPGLFAVLAANAGKAIVRMLPGAWYAKTVQQVPSNTVLEMSPGTIIYSEIAQLDGWQNATLKVSGGHTGSDLQLQADTTVGATSLTLGATTGLSVGGWIWIGCTDAIAATQYQIVSITGASAPYTITVDRPIRWVFTRYGQPHAAVVYKSTPGRNIHIFGNGATIQGTADRAIEFIGCVDCSIEGLRLISETRNAVTGFSGFVASFDNGSVRCAFRDLWIDCNSQAIYGFSLESNEGSIADRVYVKNTNTGAGCAGAYVYESVDCTLRNVHVERCYYGVSVDYESSAAAWLQSSGIVVDTCTADACGVDGFWINGGPGRAKLVNCKATRCTGYGIRVQDGALAGATHAVLASCEADLNTAGGIYLGSTGNVTLQSCSAYANATYGMGVASGDVAANGLDLRDNVSKQLLILGGNVDVSGLISEGGDYGIYQAAGVSNVRGRCQKLVNGDWTGAVVYGTAKADLHLSFAVSGTGTKTCVSQTNNSTVRLSNTRVTSGAPTNGYVAVTNHMSSLRREGNVDFGACTTPWTIPDAGQANYGTVTLNGATGVGAPSADASSTRAPTLTRATIGGTPGAPPMATQCTVIAIPDGDMSGADTTAWTASNVVLSKEAGTPPNGTTRVLRVAYDGSHAQGGAFCAVAPLLSNSWYHFRGWARGDGTAVPRLYDSSGALLWIGTSSTTWQKIDVVKMATNTGLELYAGSLAAGRYCEFALIETVPGFAVTGIASDTSVYNFIA